MSSLRRYVSAARNRARRLIKRSLLHFAPVVTCERCGRPLFSGFPVIGAGRLHVFGAEEITVQVEWSSRRTLRFRHEALDLCRRGDETLLSLGELGNRGSSAPA
jgi:hypothetical protein